MPRLRAKDPDAARFGAIVARLRRQHGWTLADFAQKTGMNATWLSVLEHGGNVPKLTTILLIAAALGVQAADMVREVEQGRAGVRP